MFISSAYFLDPPDPTSRQPFTTAAFLPLWACHFLLAVLAILPHTHTLRLAMAPVMLWQAWNCAVGLDFSAGVAKLLGRDSVERLNHWNFAYGVRNPLLSETTTSFLTPPFHAFFLLMHACYGLLRSGCLP
jgi:hypothetical protein